MSLHEGPFFRHSTLLHSKTRLIPPVIAAATLFVVTSLAYDHHAPFQRLIDSYAPGLRNRI